MGGQTLTRFVQDSNGYVELMTDVDTAHEYGYGSVDDLIYDYDPSHTYLMACYDDLSSSHRGFYGYRFVPGCVIFHWTAPTFGNQNDGELINSFQMMLWEDGDVTWQFGASNSVDADYDLFTGVFCGYGVNALFEVARDTIPQHVAYRWSAAGLIGGDSFDTNGNGVPDDCELVGDLDSDGDVDVNDMIAVLAAWGECGGCPADLDGDGFVDVGDFIMLLANWTI